MPETTNAGDPGLTWPVERGKLREFAAAILDDNADYQREDAHIPVTFPWTKSFWRPPAAATRSDRAQPNMARVLHGEQEYQYLGPVRVGDVLTARSRVVDQYTKAGRRGGSLRFTVTETTVTNQHEEVVILERSTVILTERATSETNT
jgi:hypothetical protein